MKSLEHFDRTSVHSFSEMKYLGDKTKTEVHCSKFVKLIFHFHGCCKESNYIPAVDGDLKES